MEDANSPETHAWVEAENKLTFGYLHQIPSRDRIHERVAQLWDYEKFGVPQKEGGHYFFSKNSGLQNQSVIYTAPTLDQNLPRNCSTPTSSPPTVRSHSAVTRSARMAATWPTA